jgi:hypothetical protein
VVVIKRGGERRLSIMLSDLIYNASADPLLASMLQQLPSLRVWAVAGMAGTSPLVWPIEARIQIFQI